MRPVLSHPSSYLFLEKWQKLPLIPDVKFLITIPVELWLAYREQTSTSITKVKLLKMGRYFVKGQTEKILQMKDTNILMSFSEIWC